jgi:hypothetical protein
MWKSRDEAGLLAAIIIWLVIPVPGRAADWPQWRGPNRDGSVPGVTVPEKWPRTLKEEWKVLVGESVSSPVVVANRIYIHTRQKADEEIVLCLDLDTGKELWRSVYAAPYKLGGPAHGYEGRLGWRDVFPSGAGSACGGAETQRHKHLPLPGLRRKLVFLCVRLR